MYTAYAWAESQTNLGTSCSTVGSMCVLYTFHSNAGRMSITYILYTSSLRAGVRREPGMLVVACYTLSPQAI